MRIRDCLVLAVCAVIVAIGTLGIDATVGRPGGLQAVRYGYPFAFVTSRVDAYDPPPSAYPLRVNFSPWENPSRLDPGLLAASAAVIAAGFLAILFAFRLLARRKAA